MGLQFIVNVAGLALSESAALTRIPLAMLGRWFKGATKFAITRADVATLVANFRKRESGEVVIDYDHSTEYAAGSGAPSPAAGWLKSIEDGPDDRGVLWGLAQFTEKARAMLAAKEYKYISPVINWAARDRRTGEIQGATLTSVALTNIPVLDAMPALALSEASRVNARAAAGPVFFAPGWVEEREARAAVALSDAAGGQGNDGGEMGEVRHLFNDHRKLSQHLCDLAHKRATETGATFKQALHEIYGEYPTLVRLREALYMEEEAQRHGAKTYELINGELREIDSQLQALTQAAMQAHPELTYGQAFKAVCSEHTDLVRLREAFRRQLE